MFNRNNIDRLKEGEDWLCEVCDAPNSIEVNVDCFSESLKKTFLAMTAPLPANIDTILKGGISVKP